MFSRGEITVQHVVRSVPDTENKVVLGFVNELKIRRSRGPNGYKYVERKYASAGTVADLEEIHLDNTLHLVALGFAQKVFVGIETMEDLWSYSILGLRIKPNARSSPVFQDAEGQAWRYYTAMQSYQTKAKQAGVIGEGQRAVFYDVTQAGQFVSHANGTAATLTFLSSTETFSEAWYEKRGRLPAEESHADGWGERFLDEADEPVEEVVADEEVAAPVGAADEEPDGSDGKDSDSILDLIQAKKAYLKRLVKQLKA